MVYRHPFVIILFSFFLISCVGENRVERALSIAESLIDSQPDSSLRILESISPEDLSSKRDRARFSLLYSKALDKNYIDIASDSIILPAVAYYGNRENKNAMMTWYYDGIVHKNAGELLPAMIALDQSRHIAEKNEDYHYLGLILRTNAEILDKCFDMENSISSYCKAVAAFEKAGDHNYADYARLSLALANNNALRFEEEKKILQELMQKDSLDSNLLSHVYRAYASCFLSTDPPCADSALWYYQLAASSPNSSPFRARDILHLAYAYELAGEEEMADMLMQKMDGYPNQDGAQGYNHGRYLIYLHRGEYEAALHALEESLEIQTSVLYRRINESVSYALSLHYSSLAEKRKEEIRNKSRLGLIILICILAICAYFMLRSRKKHRQLEKQMRDTLLVSSELDQIKEMNEEISVILDRFVQDKISSMRNLADKFFLYSKKGEEWLKEKKGIATKDELLMAFKKDLESLRSDRSFIDAMEARINLLTGGRFAQFRKDVAEEEHLRKKKTALLDRSDYDILVLFISGFPVKTICYLTGLPDYVISERIYRYRMKLAFLPEDDRALLFSKAPSLRRKMSC